MTKDCKIAIGIAYHKDGEFYRKYPYIPIQVGAALSTVDLGIQRDDEGNNISVYNPYYSELSATYWLWKNVNADYKGLFHYRRFLTFRSNYFIKRLPTLGLYIASKIAAMFIPDSRCFFPHFSTTKLSEDLVAKYLSEFSMDLQKDIEQNNIDCYTLGSMRHSTRSVRTHINLGIGGKHFEVLDKIIKDSYPEIYNLYVYTLKQNKIYAYNIIIAKEHYYDEYCTMLFNILGDYRSYYINGTTTVNKALLRDLGYIGEIITNLFVHKIINEGAKHKTLNCAFVEGNVTGLSYNPDSVWKRIITLIRQ